MGFLKALGKIAGSAAGAVIGAPVYFAGAVVNSDFLREIGEGAYKVTSHTGELLGSVTEGVSETVYGIIKSDGNMQSEGIEKVFDSGAEYLEGMGKGIARMAENGLETVDAILEGDKDRVIKAGKEIAKTVAVGVLAIGVLDVIDGLDIFDGADDGVTIADNDDYIENPNVHHVMPHERLLPDSRTIWVDGDGNTAVDTYDGWIQSNPDYKA